MNLEGKFLINKDKPPVLFHASSNTNIEVFEPRSNKVRDAKEGPKVFATPSRALASVFLIETDDSWVGSGVADGVPYIIISDEERFKKLDKGGAIYSLPNATFENDPNKGLGKFEWTSAEPVKPVLKETITSALNDMLHHGVKVYFVDKDTYLKYKEVVDPADIIHTLAPFNS